MIVLRFFDENLMKWSFFNKNSDIIPIVRENNIIMKEECIMLRFSSPFDPIDRMSKDIFENLSSPFERNKMDIIETEASYRVVIDAPGFDKENISVSVKNNDILVISGKIEKTVDEDESGRKYVVRARSTSNFERTLALPDNADIPSIKASCKNGVLTVEIPKKEPPEEKSLNISIE